LLRVYSLDNYRIRELNNDSLKALSYLHKNLIVHRVC
jgi:serine/threonine protein kinase